MNHTKLILVFTLLVNLIQAQSKNIFLDREFWEKNPSITLIEQKIEEGNDATELNQFGFDPVVYAILSKTPNTIIKHLLSKKGNGVNKLTHDKRTYVFWAAYANNVALMKHLIANNAKMNLKDSHQFSVLTFAAATGQTNTEIYDVCINNGIDVKTDLDEHGTNALLLLIPYLKDFKLVDYFTNKGLELHSTDTNGNGAFNYAARKGNKEMLALLIKKGLPYKNNNKNGGNAMLLASQGSRKGYNPLSFFKHLENLGITSNITNNNGNTVLHNLAYSNKDLETLNYFLSKNIDANQKDDKGNTPLINAASRNTLTIISTLTNKTKNINHINKKGYSVLTKAMNNSLETITFLLDQGADINVIDGHGNNLAYHLIKTFKNKNSDKFYKKIKVLIKRGLDIKQTQKNGNTLYHLAIENSDNLDLLKLVNTLDIDINEKNKKGLTVLHLAAMKAKDNSIIKYLLEIGADKSITTDFNESVYGLAKENELLNKQNIDITFLK